MKTITITSKVYGTNAERLAMNLSASDVEIEFYETDTNFGYKWKGSEWIQTANNGANTTRVVATEVAFPAEWYTNTTGSAAASATDNVLIYQSTDISSYNYHLIENLAATDPVDIFVSIDGTNFSTVAAAVELIDDVTTGGGIKAIDIPVTKIGVLRGKFKALKVLRKGTTNEAQSIRIAHGVM